MKADAYSPKKFEFKKETLQDLQIRTDLRAGLPPKTCNNACFTTTNDMCKSVCGPCSKCG